MAISVMSRNTLFRETLLSFFREHGFKISGIYDTYSDLRKVSFGEVFVIHATQADHDLPEKMHRLTKLNPDVRTVVLASDEVGDSLKERLANIATAVIPESQSAETLVCALKLVHAGFRITPGVGQSKDGSHSVPLDMAGLNANPSPSKADTDVSTLSKREVAVLAHICSGETNKTIAKALGISDATVKAHLRSSFRKIGVKNRTQAAIWASENF